MPGPGTPPPGQPFGGNRMIRGGKGEEGGRGQGEGGEGGSSVHCMYRSNLNLSST